MNQTYTVKRGDTLYGISNQFGVSVADLARINNVDPSRLQIGQVLIIPTASGTNPDSSFIYTVKKGDSLYSIAKRYNTTVNDIVKLNNLKSTNLSIGQSLRIPEKYNSLNNGTIPSYTNYVVKRGDTLYSIARNNNLTVDQIIKDNNLANNNLSVGQVLKLRTIDGTVEECFGEDYEEENAPQTITYVVKKGDNLYSIARKFNTSVDNIKRKNNLASNLLSIGQLLKI